MSQINELSPRNDSAELVSVVIPAYNVARFIKEALDSVFAQTYRHYEVIVVNDGSPDTPEFEKVLLPYIDRITYIKQENRGIGGARDTGLRAAKGSLVAFLDADDMWLPDYLAEQAKFLHDHPEFDLVYSNARIFGESVHAGKEYMDVCPSEGEATAAAIISRRCHVFTSVMARTDILKDVGFDESLRSCEDFDCWLRFTARGHRIGYHRKVLVLYRKHNTGLTANPTQMAEYSIRVLTKSLSLWPADSEEGRLLREAKADKIAGLETIRGKIALRNQDFPVAIAHLKVANGHYRSAKMYAVIALLKVAPRIVATTYRLRGELFLAHRGI